MPVSQIWEWFPIDPALTIFYEFVIRFSWWTPKLWLIALGFSSKGRSFEFQTVSWRITVSWQILTHRRSFWIILTGSTILSIRFVPNVSLVQYKGVRTFMILSPDLTDGGSDRRNFIHAKLSFGDSHNWGHMLPDCYFTFCLFILSVCPWG